MTTTAGLLRQDPALRDVDVEINGVAPLVPADPDMLRIVFQNLLINGAHAMQERARSTWPSRPSTHLSDCVHRRWPGHSSRNTREDFYAVLYDQVARLRPGSTHRETPRRGTQRTDRDHLSASRRHQGGHPSPDEHVVVLSEGLRPSDSPTRSLARRFAGALFRLRSKLRRDLAEAPSREGGRRVAHSLSLARVAGICLPSPAF